MIVPKLPGTVGTGTTSVTPGVPAAADLVNGCTALIFVSAKPDTSVINTPASWTKEDEKAGGGGTVGNLTGPTIGAVLSRVKDAGWSTMPAISVTNGSPSAAYCVPYIPAGGSSLVIACTDGEYTGNGTAWSTTFASDPGIQAGDRILVFCTNQSAAPTWSAQALSVPGCTLTAAFERSEGIENTTGNDTGGMLAEWYVKSGSSTGAATFTATCSAGSRGAAILVRLRESGFPNNLIDGVEPEASGSWCGPVVDGNGNLYRITEEYLSTNQAQPEFGNHIMVMKSTDNGVTWKRMDAAAGPGYAVQGSFNDIESAWVAKRLTKQAIVIMHLKASDRWWGHVFRTSDHATNPDTWDATSLGTSSGIEQFAATQASESGICAVSLSDGKIRAFVRGTKQSTFDAFAHRIMAASGVSWSTTPGYITDTNLNMTRPSAVVSTNNDDTFLVYRDHTNGQVRARIITSADSVGSSFRVDSSGAGAGATAKYENNVVPPVYYRDGSDEVYVVGFVNASDQLRTVEIRNGTPGSEQVVSTNTLPVNPTDLSGSSTDNQGPSAALAVLGTTVYAFWGNTADGDVYWASRANGGSWGSATKFVETGTGQECHWLYAGAVSSTKIGVTYDIGRHFDDDSNIFYGELAASSTIDLTATAISSGEAFGTTTVIAPITVSPTAIASAEAFGTQVVTVVSSTTVSPTAIAGAEAFGTQVVNVKTNLSPTAIAGAEAFGTTVVNVKTNLSPTAIAGAEAFGTTVVNVITSLVPTAIAGAEAFGTTIVNVKTNLSPTAIGSAEAFGTTLVSILSGLQPTGIASAEAFGTQSVIDVFDLTFIGIASAEAFGTTVLTGKLDTSPTGIASGETFGTALVNVITSLSFTGITSAEAFGTQAVIDPFNLIANGIVSAEAFGNATQSGALITAPIGIASAEAFGTTVVGLILTVSPTAIASAQAFGTPVLALVLTASPTGIASAQAFGNPVVSMLLIVSPTGIVSAEAFGNPTRVIPFTGFTGWGIPI